MLKIEKLVIKPYAIDPQQHVKIWFSKDGLPEKHQARFIKFLALNPKATLKLIYADEYLTPEGRKNIQDFASKTGIIVIDYNTIIPIDEEEQAIKQWIDHELKYYFIKSNPVEKGNLSVVSDQLRLLQQVINFGIDSDCDVEFHLPLPQTKIIAQLGFIAKTRKGVDGNKGGVRISNDMMAGDPQHPVFAIAKQLVCQHNAKYHAALPAYFRAHNIAFDPDNYKNHPLYYQARNAQIKQFSLGGGPQIFAIAVHLCGIATGYESSKEAEVFVLDEALNFKPYTFLNCKNKKQVREDFARLLPGELGKSLIASWDHSWLEGNNTWKILSASEQILLRRFNQLRQVLFGITYFYVIYRASTFPYE